MTPNILIAALIMLCTTGLAVLLAMRGHAASPAFIVVLGFWFAASVYQGSNKPFFSIDIQITKQTASEAEKEAP